MIIKSVSFLGAIGQIGQAQPETARGLPQVVFSGRSNVGKSSLINRFVGRTRTPIARISGQPGKTQEINFFEVKTDREPFVLTDLPGYGYARAPAALRDRWRTLIGDYLSKTSEIAGVIQLIDIRHEPSKDDRAAIEMLAEMELPVLFVLTKSDKLKPSKRDAAAEGFRKEFGIEPEQAIVSSSTTGEGREELLEGVSFLLETESLREGIEQQGEAADGGH